MSHLIHVAEVPGLRAPYGPYSTAIVNERTGDVSISGRIAPPAEGTEKSIEEQTVDIMRDFHCILGHLGIGFDLVTETGVFIAGKDGAEASDADFATFNAVYGGYLDLFKSDQGLPPGNYPARYTILPRLLKGAGVELMMRASLPETWTPDQIGMQQDISVYALDEVKAFVEGQKAAQD